MTTPRLEREMLAPDAENAALTALIEVATADFGEDIVYDESLSDSGAEERYSERLEDYADAHAEAEAGLQDLSAG
jgi:hypothetical protein